MPCRPGRLKGLRGVEALERLYAASRLFVNFFQPSFKLIGKQRQGARARKRHLPPQTPYGRLVASKDIDERTKEKLRTLQRRIEAWRLQAAWRPIFSSQPLFHDAATAVRTS